MALGPADYTLVLARRGGEPVAELPWRTINWQRVLDDMSSASADVPISRPEHPMAWAAQQAEAWVHELVVMRGGDLVWAGPLLQPKWTSTGLNLAARDLFQWFERRSLRQNVRLNEDLADIFATFAAIALAEDQSPNIVIEPKRTGVTGMRTITAASNTRAADALRELATTGLDFTAIGRQIITGGEEVPAKRLAPITNDVLRNPELTGAGDVSASRTVVIGNRVGGSGGTVIGIDGGVGGETGLVERVFNESTIGDDHSAEVAAATRLDALKSMPLYLSGQLDQLRAPPIADLVPGAIAPVEVLVGCRWVLGDMRLIGVQASVNVADGGVNEQIKVDFAPVGTKEST